MKSAEFIRSVSTAAGSVAFVVASCFLAAVPLWLLWAWLAPAYLSALPAWVQYIPLAHVFGALLLIAAVRRAWRATK